VGRKNLSWILVEIKPYIDIDSEDSVIRRFSQEIDPVELLWHRDLKNRSVKILEGKDWKIQMENELPKSFDNITIPSLTWHRVIKGSGDLVLQIKEWE
jgi:hypothetical protein